MRVISLTSFNETASSRFRIRQFAQSAEKNNCEWLDLDLGNRSFGKRAWMRFCISSKFNGIHYMRVSPLKELLFDVALFERRYWDVQELNAIREMGVPCIFCADDYDLPAASLMLEFDGYILSNEFLKRDVEVLLNANINDCSLIIPTVLDSERFNFVDAAIKSNCDDVFTVVWSGYSKNTRYFSELGSSLERFLQQYPSKLRVISEDKPNLKQFGIHEFEWLKWSPETEVSGLHDLGVGIMPLHNGDFELRKGGFKLLQYFMMGGQALASPVGVNIEYMNMMGFGADNLPNNEDEWYASFCNCYDAWTRGLVDSRSIRERAQAHFSLHGTHKEFFDFIKRYT